MASPIITTRLAVKHPHGSVSFYQQDLSPITPIRLLKKDMAHKLGIPADGQVWRYKNRLLEGHKTLNDYNVDINDVIEVKDM